MDSDDLTLEILDFILSANDSKYIEISDEVNQIFDYLSLVTAKISEIESRFLLVDEQKDFIKRKRVFKIFKIIVNQENIVLQDLAFTERLEKITLILEKIYEKIFGIPSEVEDPNNPTPTPPLN